MSHSIFLMSLQLNVLYFTFPLYYSMLKCTEVKNSQHYLMNHFKIWPIKSDIFNNIMNFNLSYFQSFFDHHLNLNFESTVHSVNNLWYLLTLLIFNWSYVLILNFYCTFNSFSSFHDIGLKLNLNLNPQLEDVRVLNWYFQVRGEFTWRGSKRWNHGFVSSDGREATDQHV